MTAFDRLTTPVPLDDPAAEADFSFGWDIPATWGQSRTCFGGLVMAGLVRALEQVPGVDERPLRSVSASLIGPTSPGPARIDVQELRRGSNVLGLVARLTQGEALATHVTALCGKARAADGEWCELEPPDQPAWQTLDPLPVVPPIAPEFTQHVEFRSEGPYPFTGSDRRDAIGWVRMLDPGADRGCAHVAALIDAWWPGVAQVSTTFRPVATVAYTIDFVGEIGEATEAPLAYRARMPAARGGYAVECRELWTADGRLLALNQQTIALIK